MRPARYWRRFWAPAWLIVTCLLQKKLYGRWLSLLSRQRQQYWQKGFLLQNLRDGLEHPLLLQQLSPLIFATHSLTHREIVEFPQVAHPSFAVPPPCPGG
jgi:hypothetical protein